MIMKILVIGKDGQLGKTIKDFISSNYTNTYKHDISFIGRKDLNLTNIDKINFFFDKKKYDIIVNCSAYTSVDQAEKNSNANLVNNIAVSKISKIAAEKKIVLIHISTDYVFDGKNIRPYKELDKTNPINKYGQTKLDGEKAIQKNMPINGIIIRTSWLYSEHGNNFVKTMIKLGKKKKEISVISDQYSSPTYAGDLVEIIFKFIENKSLLEKNFNTDIFHFSNKGITNWHQFATEIFKLAKLNCVVKSISSSEYLADADRPKYSALDSSKIMKKFGMKNYKWKNSLKRCINNLS